jgi:hypothetical protein
MKYTYHLAYDDGNILIRVKKGVPIQKYDFQKNEWIDDFNMLGIYSNDIPVRHITESDAKKMILMVGKVKCN